MTDSCAASYLELEPRRQVGDARTGSHRAASFSKGAAPPLLEFKRETRMGEAELADDDSKIAGVSTLPPPASGDAYNGETAVREIPPEILNAIRKRAAEEKALDAPESPYSLRELAKVDNVAAVAVASNLVEEAPFVFPASTSHVASPVAPVPREPRPLAVLLSITILVGTVVAWSALIFS
jgi:hypothetical protein